MLQFHDILDLDLDSFACRDIPNAGAEDISSVLFQQACGFVSVNGRPECRSCIVLLLYDTFDDSPADMASKGYDGAGLVEREGVPGAGDWGDSGRVDECLGEKSARGGVVEFGDRGHGDLGEPLKPKAAGVKIFDTGVRVSHCWV